MTSRLTRVLVPNPAPDQATLEWHDVLAYDASGGRWLIADARIDQLPTRLGTLRWVTLTEIVEVEYR